jgi:hypothetical protein
MEPAGFILVEVFFAFFCETFATFASGTRARFQLDNARPVAKLNLSVN